jgi:hypothetical protein
MSTPLPPAKRGVLARRWPGPLRGPLGSSASPGRRDLLLAICSVGAIGAAAALWPVPAGASTTLPAELAAELPGARLQGSGRLRFFGLHVYDARLWTGERRAAAGDWAATPLALEIEYARRLVGAQIAERSLEEMRRQGAIAEADAARWLAEMKQLFPDVAAGDRITGVKVPGIAARFFVNGRFRGEVRDAEFTRRFFGIWLARESSQPALRDALLGAGSAGL